MRWGVIFALVLVFVVACEPVSEEALPVVEQPPVAPLPAVQPVPEQPPAPQPTMPLVEEGVYERPPATGPSIAAFFDVFTKNVKNYKFTYKGDIWRVAGKNARIELFRPLQNQYHAPYLDTIYLDLARRTAIGVCEGRNINIRKQCAVVHNTLNKKYAVPYIQFKSKLPEEWFVEFQNLYVAPSETPHLIMDRETVHLKHSTKIRITDFYIDPSSGLPVVVIDNDVEYHYENLAKNQLGPTESVMLPE